MSLLPALEMRVLVVSMCFRFTAPSRKGKPAGVGRKGRRGKREVRGHLWSHLTSCEKLQFGLDRPFPVLPSSPWDVTERSFVCVCVSCVCVFNSTHTPSIYLAPIVQRCADLWKTLSDPARAVDLVCVYVGGRLCGFVCVRVPPSHFSVTMPTHPSQFILTRLAWMALAFRGAGRALAKGSE